MLLNRGKRVVFGEILLERVGLVEFFEFQKLGVLLLSSIDQVG